MSTKKSQHGAFLWTIESWQSLSKLPNKKRIDSDPFNIKGDRINWYLALYPDGEDDKDQGYISIVVNHFLTGSTILEGSVEVSLLDQKNRKILSKKSTNSLMLDNDQIIFPKFINKRQMDERVKNILKESRIVLMCEINLKKLSSTIVEKPTINSIKSEPCGSSNLTMDPCKSLKLSVPLDQFEKFLEDKKFSDVVFKIGEREIHLHKIILVNKSCIFAAMFEDVKQENNQNFVEITDTEYNIFKEMLRFMYTGKVDKIENIVGNLLVAADKYCVEDLKKECETVISRNITLNNVVACLEVAISCNTSILKKKVFEFILSKKKIVLDKPEFKALVKRDSDLMLEVFQAIANSK